MDSEQAHGVAYTLPLLLLLLMMIMVMAVKISVFRDLMACGCMEKTFRRNPL